MYKKVIGLGLFIIRNSKHKNNLLHKTYKAGRSYTYIPSVPTEFTYNQSARGKKDTTVSDIIVAILEGPTMRRLSVTYKDCRKKRISCTAD